MTVARKSKRSETIQAGQKYFSVQQRQNLNWNKSPFLCGSPPNSRIMYQLLRKGKLSATTSDIADYLAYTVKFAELLESQTLASALMYDNEYRKLQCEHGFRWGSDSQHLHTRFLVKRRSSVLTTNAPNSQKIFPTP